MKRRFGIISLIVCLSMMLSFVACGENAVDNNNELNNVQNDDTTNDNEAVNDNNSNNEDDEIMAPDFKALEGADISEHMTINYMGRNTNDPDIDKYSYVKDVLEDMFNITFDFASTSSKNEDMELLAAADSIPECAWVYLGDTQKAWTLYESGLTRSIPMEYVQRYAPYLWKAMQIDQSYHPTQLVPGTDDEYYTLFCDRGDMYKIGGGMAVRMDWLENLGMTTKGTLETIVEDSVYITDEAYLLKELTEILYEFTFSDPDMNGENDTFGMATYGLQVDGFAYGGTLYSAFSIQNEYTPDENGWAVPVIYSIANFRFYEQLGAWKELGVMPEGFETKAVSNWEDMWESGKYGVTSFEEKQLSVDSKKLVDGFVDDSVPLSLFNTSPDAKIILTPPLLDDDGTGGGARPYENFSRCPRAGYFYVRDDVSDEKLKRILMFMDYISYYPEGIYLCINGLEGLHWERDASNKVVYFDQTDFPDNMKWEPYDFFNTPNAVNSLLWDVTPEPIERTVQGTFLNVRYAMHTFALDNWPDRSYSYIDGQIPITWAQDIEWFEMSNMQARSKAFKAARTAIINNDGDLDTIWDNYMNTLNTLGFQEYLVDLNTHAFLRDELFYDGIAMTPAEKFPLD